MRAFNNSKKQNRGYGFFNRRNALWVLENDDKLCKKKSTKNKIMNKISIYTCKGCERYFTSLKDFQKHDPKNCILFSSSQYSEESEDSEKR